MFAQQEKQQHRRLKIGRRYFRFGHAKADSRQAKRDSRELKKFNFSQIMIENRSFRSLLSSSQIILSVVALGFLLFYTKTIILPLLLAFLLYNLVIPVLDFLEMNLHLPRLISCTLIFLTVVSLPILLAVPFSSIINKVIEDAHLYRDQITSMFSFAEQRMAALGFDFDESMWVMAMKEVPYSTYLQEMASWFVDILIYIGLVLLFFLFILASRRSPQYRSALFNEINRSISKYLALKASISALTAISVGSILYVLDLEFALLIAILTFLLNFIPNIGSILASILPLPMALLDYRGIEWFLAVMLLPAGVQLFFGNIVEPKWQGDSLKLHPITILLALLVWGLVWGPAGMFVAVPLTTVAKIFIDRAPKLHWLGQLMEGDLSGFWQDEELEDHSVEAAEPNAPAQTASFSST
ncbi:MAG: AI-2E family transporter [Oligoflexus sp.]